LKTLKRSATTVEKRILFRYTGFGASELVENCFAGIYPRDVPNDIEREIQQLIPADQLDVLVRNLQFAHYTPHWVAKGIWRALSATSFMGGNILEPSIGTGVLVAPLPNHLVSHAGITGVEIDPTTAEIAQLLYPFWHIRNADFINLVFPPIFDLVLANPPIEEVSVRNPTSAPLHELFLAKALTHLAPNGIAIVITTGELLSNGLSVRITNTASLMGAFRLPSDCFGTTSGAAASADLLVFRRHG
jgi:type I restriction-modification system DNA methylase subunit